METIMNELKRLRKKLLEKIKGNNRMKMPPTSFIIRLRPLSVWLSFIQEKNDVIFVAPKNGKTFGS